MERITDGITNPAMKKYYDAVINAKSDDELKAIYTEHNKELDKFDEVEREQFRKEELLAIKQMMDNLAAVAKVMHQEVSRMGYKDK